MDKNRLKSIIVEQKEYLKQRETGYIRDALKVIKPKLKFRHNIVITGSRRCGKSTLLVQIMHHCLEPESYYFLRFDDERLLHFQADDFNLLYECFLELEGERSLFIFDEIQNVKGWERYVNRMYEQGMKFFLTGSNSNLLSTELSSLLTGRHIDFELYPFSFREFLKTMDYEYNENDILNTQRKARLNKLFSEYLVSGGYPEYLLYRDTQILQELFRDVITKDIVLRHNVREARALRELAGYLVSNVTSFVSYNKLRKQYSLGSTHTVKNYLEYFTEVYLFFELPMFSYSVNRQIQNNRKIYAIDNGIVKANGFAFSENAGKQLENMVFIELKRRGKEIFYHKGKYECDFLLKEGDRVIQAIQVTLHMDEDNRARELRGLKEAMETYDLKQGTILTLDQKDSFKQGKKTIKAVPVYEWILSGN